jgi:hypothetical protein
MRLAKWMRRQLDRPIAEHERQTAMAVIVVLLASVALLLSFTQPPSTASPTRGVPPKPTRTDPFPGEARQTAEQFLSGYLAYAYGQAPADQIVGASRRLILSLESDPPRVAPAIRARHPRVLSLHPAAAPAGRLGVTATVNDGGLIDYQVGLVLAHEGGRLLVTALEGAR